MLEIDLGVDLRRWVRVVFLEGGRSQTLTGLFDFFKSIFVI